jgi:hypothetical protein
MLEQQKENAETTEDGSTVPEEPPLSDYHHPVAVNLFGGEAASGARQLFRGGGSHGGFMQMCEDEVDESNGGIAQ